MLLRPSLAATTLALLAATAPAATASETRGQEATAAAQRAAADTVRVSRSYGGPPVRVDGGGRVVLTFEGRAGDLVRLTLPVPGGGGRPLLQDPTEKSLTSLRSASGRTVASNALGYYRLPSTGRFRFDYRHRVFDATTTRVQLVKQVRIPHDGTTATRVPKRRGFQYAVRLPVSRDLRVVSFGTPIESVLTAGSVGRVGYGSESITLGAGVSLGDDGGFPLTEPLAKGQRVWALLPAKAAGRVVTTRPTTVAGDVDGPAAPIRRDGAVTATLSAADLAGSPGGLLHVRVTGSDDPSDWTVVVVRPDGTLNPVAAPGRDGVVPKRDIHQLTAPGSYRVLAYPRSPGLGRASIELDSVADGGTVAIDGPGVVVPARPDGRFTLLTMTGAVDTTRYLSVSSATVVGPWQVHAGLLEPDCVDLLRPSCGEAVSAVATDQHPVSDDALHVGTAVVVMPLAGQTSGTLTVRVATTP